MSWQGLNFDFTGVVFDGGDFTDARFSGGIVLFTGTVFSGGEVSFHRAAFSGGEVGFDRARFSGGTVSFAEAGIGQIRQRLAGTANRRGV